MFFSKNPKTNFLSKHLSSEYQVHFLMLILAAENSPV